MNSILLVPDRRGISGITWILFFFFFWPLTDEGGDRCRVVNRPHDVGFWDGATVRTHFLVVVFSIFWGVKRKKLTYAPAGNGVN